MIDRPVQQAPEAQDEDAALAPDTAACLPERWVKTGWRRKQASTGTSAHAQTTCRRLSLLRPWTWAVAATR